MPKKRKKQRHGHRREHLSGGDRIVVRAGRRDPDAPSTCIPSGATTDPALSLEAHWMLAILRMHQNEDSEPTAEALANLGGCTEDEALALVAEVKASGWLYQRGCRTCPTGHLCARTDGTGLSNLEHALLRTARNAEEALTGPEAAEALHLNGTDRQLASQEAWTALTERGLLRVTAPADGENACRCEITERGHEALALET